MEAHANSVQICSKCEKLVLVPKQHDPKIILRQHQESGCTKHLLPPVKSIAVQCERARCTRRDRVVQTCPECKHTFCLRHRHATDHECPSIDERKQRIEAEAQKKKDMQAAIKEKFTGETVNAKSAVDEQKQKTDEQIASEKIKKAEAAKAAIAQAKANVAARTSASENSSSASSSSTPKATTAESVVASTANSPAQPKVVKKASRVVTLMKMRKTAQGEDKIPVSSRVYVYIRSPVFPNLDDKAVYVDKTWTLGRSLDKIVAWLKVTVPKNEPFDAQKRFSIFHAKEIEDTPILLNLQDRLEQVSIVENGDIFFLAPADWEWITK
ncbi:hypothetical protein BGZ46_007072 [Entomortierella lignicola]|nr:hypothetical protein BGZ46_007072 [Entomortierella lignicola]